jgi:hypothetical protein
MLQHYALFNFAKRYALAHKITQSFEVDDAAAGFPQIPRLRKDPLHRSRVDREQRVAALQSSRASFSSMPSDRKKA